MNEYMFPNEKEELKLSPETGFIMKEAATWGKAMAIIGFVCVGIQLLFTLVLGLGASIAGGLDLPMASPGILIFINLIVAAISFFPAYFLFKATVNMRKALVMEDTATLNSAFESLKNYFLFNVILSGICMLVGLVAMFASMLMLCW